MPEVAMTPQVFSLLSGLVEERVGLWYALADRTLFESKLATRVEDLGFDSALDYYYFLRYDEGAARELDLLTEALVVNETFFFRELDQIEAVLSALIVPLIERGLRPRIWCAACSTGEEPSTIAMWLDHRGLLDEVTLVASDVSDAVLSIARSGRYRPRSLRQPPRTLDPARWIETENGTLVVHPRIRAAIDWRKINLMDTAAVRATGEHDLILCRNVLIYFRDETVRRVVQSLADQLRPNGALLVGVAESLMRFGTRLSCEEHNGAFVYRKVE